MRPAAYPAAILSPLQSTLCALASGLKHTRLGYDRWRMRRLSHRSVRYSGPKRSVDAAWGAKRNFLIRGEGATVHGGRATESCQSLPRGLGSPRVDTIHVQAPTPHTPPLQSFLVDFSSRPLARDRPRFFRPLGTLGRRIDGVCGAGDYPQPDLPRDRRGADLPRKKRAIWTRWRRIPVKNVNYPRAPVVAVAVSSDPILPQR